MEMTQDFALRLNTETQAYATCLSKKRKSAKGDSKGGIHRRTAQVSVINKIFVGKFVMRAGNESRLASGYMNFNERHAPMPRKLYSLKISMSSISLTVPEG